MTASESDEASKAISGHSIAVQLEQSDVWNNMAYWVLWNAGTGAGQVVSAPVGGGNLTPVVGDQNNIPRQPTRSLIVNGTGLYWADENMGIFRVVGASPLANISPDVPIGILPYPMRAAVRALTTSPMAESARETQPAFVAMPTGGSIRRSLRPPPPPPRRRRSSHGRRARGGQRFGRCAVRRFGRRSGRRSAYRSQSEGRG